MAGVATGAIVNEGSNSRVFRGDLRLIAVLVANDTSEDRVVRGIRVAVGAGSPLAIVSSAVDGEVGRVVGRVFRARPIHEGVA